MIIVFKQCSPIKSLWLPIKSTMEYDYTKASKVPPPVILKKSQQNSKSTKLGIQAVVKITKPC